MFESPILYGIAAGVGIALIAGVVGCFIVWRRMAYFGDALAHSALLGIALGLVAGISTDIGVLISSAAFAVLLLWLQQKKILATDTLLGILAHASLSIGIVAISLVQRYKEHAGHAGHEGHSDHTEHAGHEGHAGHADDGHMDLHAYLFGDILTITPYEIGWIYIGGGLLLTALRANWSSLVLMTIHKDLAQAENVRVFLMHILLISATAIVVALAMRTIGILLIASLLIIPAATARQLARSPEAMVIVASLLGIVAVLIGVNIAAHFEIPSGAAIVATSSILFMLLFPLSGWLTKRY